MVDFQTAFTASAIVAENVVGFLLPKIWAYPVLYIAEQLLELFMLQIKMPTPTPTINKLGKLSSVAGMPLLILREEAGTGKVFVFLNNVHTVTVLDEQYSLACIPGLMVCKEGIWDDVRGDWYSLARALEAYQATGRVEEIDLTIGDIYYAQDGMDF